MVLCQIVGDLFTPTKYYRTTPTVTYIMYVDNYPVGYICLRTKINEQWKRWSGNFYYQIRSSERRKGYATKMLSLGLNKLKEFGFDEVYGQSSNGNIGSKKFLSKKATEFRIWATKILKEYMTKGFALNDERFINGNKYDVKYFDELLERIKTIRVSERMAYQKITDLFIATATDYNPKSEEAYTFFKIVQNKLHFAISGHTAAELIFERANSEKEHMGLTTWKNSPDGLIYKYDVIVAKNYLNEEEMSNLKDLTNMFLVFAEDEAKQRHIMTMKDWIEATDDLLKFRRKEVLNNSGTISHKEAVDKAEKEYEKFRVIQDQKYISSMDEFYKKYFEENNENE